MVSQSSSSASKGPLDVLIDNARFLVRPASLNAEEIHLELHMEVRECAEVFYRTARESIIQSQGEISPRDLVVARYAAVKPEIDTKELEKRSNHAAFQTFERITKKYLFGGSIGRPARMSDEERYVLHILSNQPGTYLKRPKVVNFIAARCLAGDVAFFRRLGSVLRSSKDKKFNPFNEIDYAIARYWTHPLMPLWMMTDNAGSMALSLVIHGAVQKQTYKKVRQTLALPAFPRHAIREAKLFKNQEIEYVYSSWVRVKSKKKATT
jgi:hypothetical protein